MTFNSKDTKSIYHKITSSDYLLGKYLFSLTNAFETAGIVVGYNFSRYSRNWDADKLLFVLRWGLHNREEDRRPLKNGDFEECYFVYIPKGMKLYAYYNGEDFIKKVKSCVAEVTEYFSKSEEVFDDFFDPESIDDFSLEIPENADVCQIVSECFSCYEEW